MLQRRIPASILERRKQGFEAPIGEWLRGPLAPMAGSLLLDARFRERGLFNQREVSRLWDEHRSGRRDHRHRLWQLIMLELWFREFIDKQTATPAVEGLDTPPPAARDTVGTPLTGVASA